MMGDRSDKLTTSKCFFFAGGSTGGHIYPAIAMAEQITKLEPTAKIHFFCSTRAIDSRILKQTGFEYTPLPAKGFSLRPGRLFDFYTSFHKSYKIAKKEIASNDNAMVIGIGGYVAAPVCYAAHKLKVPIALLNVDILPGRANKIIARWADEIFVQFEETAGHFTKAKARINVVGCPLRSGFSNPQPNKAIKQLGLDKNKKILLITGASSGSENINRTIYSLLEKLSGFADGWQIVHLTGEKNYNEVQNYYTGVKIRHKVLGYFDDMANLLAAADLVVGRSGAVSVAEYVAAGVPSICMPYPYHKDRHQYLNAGKLVEAGAAVIVDDLPDEKDRAEWLAEELDGLMKDDAARKQMKDNCAIVAKKDAAGKIAERLLETSNKMT
jgi:UDP-N-acetylglucosamine--N-acetylmuramyl-(pentapeptide) pyrophosphoryl-undecaprenol N-acetylglucosamine transferase